jgi:hypothetical protein
MSENNDKIISQITAELDLEKIQKKANEFATEAVIDVLKDHYGYNSNFRKALKEQIPNISSKFNLVDIQALIVDDINSKLLEIANTISMNKLIPNIAEMLLGAKQIPEISLTQIFDKYKEFLIKDDSENTHAYFRAVRESRYNWINVALSSKRFNKDWDADIHFTLHERHTKDNPTYQLLSMPGTENKHHTAKVTIGKYDVELPVYSALSNNDFARFIASLVIQNTNITVSESELGDYDEYLERNEDY